MRGWGWVVVGLAACATLGCDEYATEKAVEEPLSLAPWPLLAAPPESAGGQLTVKRAGFLLRHPAHQHLVDGQTVVLEGWVTDTSVSRAPACAFHSNREADPPGCPTSAIPSFRLGDAKTTAPIHSLAVLGWASN